MTAGFALLLALSLFFTVHPFYEKVPDSATYLATARSLLAGDGYAYLGEPFILRPPGFSVLLAPVLALAGTDFLALNLLVSLFAAAGVLLLFLFLRPRLGLLLALLVAAVIWTNPGYQRLCNQVMSDLPGTTLWIGCLLLERRLSRRPSLRGDLLLGLLIGACSLVRSVTLFLVPAILLSRLLDRVLRRGDPDPGAEPIPVLRFVRGRLLLLPLAAVLVLLPWSLRNQQVAAEPPADQTFVYSYSAGMWHQDRGDPSSPRLGLAEIGARIQPHVQAALEVLQGRGWDLEQGRNVGWLSALLLVCWFVNLLRRREPAELFVLFALPLFVVYFKFEDRLMWPVYIVMLAATVETVRDVLRRFLGARIARLLVAALLVALLVHDLRPGWHHEEIEREHERFAALCAELDRAVPADARLAAADGRYYEVLLERPVHSLFFAVHRAGQLAACETIIDKYGIDTVVLLPSMADDRALLPYFRQRYGGAAPPAAVSVFRVRP